MNRYRDMPERFRAALDAICRERGVGPANVLAEMRGSSFVCAVRDEVFATFRDMRLPGGTRPSYPQIGQWVGRHHKAIIDGERRHRARMTQNTQP